MTTTQRGCALSSRLVATSTLLLCFLYNLALHLCDRESNDGNKRVHGPACALVEQDREECLETVRHDSQGKTPIDGHSSNDRKELDSQVRDAEQDHKELNHGGLYNEGDEDGILLGGYYAARVVVKAFSSVDSVIWSRHKSSVDKVPEEFAEEDAPESTPNGADRGKDSDDLSPLVPDENTHCRSGGGFDD